MLMYVLRDCSHMHESPANAGILRGCGRQSWGAYLNLACFWVLGLPLCWYLGLHRGMGLLGLWGGIAAATAIQACVI